jgi:signal transduction histidine kinase
VNLLRWAPRAVLGAVIGVGAVLAGAWFAAPSGRELPYTVFLVIALALTGLALGSTAALSAFVAGGAALVLATVAHPGGPRLTSDELVRFLAFLIGSPAIVFLVWRAEAARRDAAMALDASRAAEARLSAESARIGEARDEVDQAFASAQRERTRLEEVAEAIQEPLIVYDDAPRGTYGNRAAMRLFGRSFIERDAEDWARMSEPRDELGRPLERDEWPQVRAQTEAIRRRLVLRLPMSGRDAIVDVEGTPIPGGAVLLLRDVGKEEDARRRLSGFASFVAHELRNPLAVAKARIELAQRDPQLPSRAGNHGRRALESVDAAIGILERLELYSRADSGRVEATREPFELGPALGAAIERLRARGSEREVLVSLAPGVRVVGDRPLSEQAITNLLTNADRYSTPGAPIHVDVTDGELVVLRVRDEGPGLSDEVAERLFTDRVAEGRGLGLGLYLVHATMEAMGGTVALEERRPCAVFALRWPSATP